MSKRCLYFRTECYFFFFFFLVPQVRSIIAECHSMILFLTTSARIRLRRFFPPCCSLSLARPHSPASAVPFSLSPCRSSVLPRARVFPGFLVNPPYVAIALFRFRALVLSLLPRSPAVLTLARSLLSGVLACALALLCSRALVLSLLSCFPCPRVSCLFRVLMFPLLRTLAFPCFRALSFSRFPRPCGSLFSKKRQPVVAMFPARRESGGGGGLHHLIRRRRLQLAAPQQSRPRGYEPSVGLPPRPGGGQELGRFIGVPAKRGGREGCMGFVRKPLPFKGLADEIGEEHVCGDGGCRAEMVEIPPQ